MQLEQFVSAQWKEFLRKKDELLMTSVNKQMINELNSSSNNLISSNNNNINYLNKNASKTDQMTPVNQTGQSNFKDLKSLITSTP